MRQIRFKPHIWSGKEIIDIGHFNTWFYGLVKDDDGNILIQEIFPGLGYSSSEIFKDDGDDKPVDIGEQFQDIASDIMYWNPEVYKKEYPKSEKIDLTSLETESVEDLVDNTDHHKLFDLFKDNRSLMLKFLDMRYLVDFFLDNKWFSYTLDEIQETIDYPGMEEDIERLIYMKVIQKDEDNFSLNLSDELVSILINLDCLLTRMGEEKHGIDT